MIEGRSANLRSWREADVEKLTDLRNDVQLQSQLLSRVRGSNPGQTRQWLEQRSSGSSSLFFVVADKKTDAPLGYIQFVDIDPIDHLAKLGICLAPEVQGKGIGTEVLVMALTYLRDYLAVRKVVLEVRDDNKRAIRCYEKIGFQHCGKYARHRYLDGRWQDVVTMELFLDAFGKP